MTKSTTISWVVLILLTIVSAFLSVSEMVYAGILIMVLAGVKFAGVAFEFMELKKANSFWKVALMSFLTLFLIVLIAINSI